ncbi:MAG: DNA mismatch repair protein MutS, partial [Firmicutes bacterium]|nr:DNA mismatch repair protein MutS [Bacillota bacterium]
FYEMFFQDAVTASRELELTLTGRDCGQAERAPMCGVPYHAIEGYLQKLVSKGYKVAICEQMEDPKQAQGLVKREVTRIVTPGTNINSDHVEEKRNNYIMSMNRTCDRMGIAICDITTGEFSVTEFEEEDKFWDEVAKYRPSEMIVNEENMGDLDIDRLKKAYEIFVNTYGAHHFRLDRCDDVLKHHFHVHSMEGLGMSEMPLAVTAAGALLDYLVETQKRDLSHISKISTYSLKQYMMLDSATRRNLELTQTLRDKSRQGSLLWVIDYTKTAMGGRLLRKWTEQPLIEKDEIQKRLDAVECFVEDMILSEELKEELSQIYDMERLMGRIAYGNASARDLLALKQSLQVLPGIKSILNVLQAPYYREMLEDFDDLSDLHALLERAIYEEPPITLREGRLIKEGYHPEVDKLRRADVDGKSWLAQLEAKEKEATGIRTLKIGYNRVFGYYLEVSKSFMNEVPDRYIRKQTLANGERYITEELKSLEDTILGAKEKLVSLEYDLFTEVRSQIAAQLVRVQETAGKVAQLDALRSLGEAAINNHYVKPKLVSDKKGTIEIIKGRHPVVERMMKEDAFIPNDTILDNKEDRIAIITGPNMAGKSTYMRQVAVICLMAQMGSFVPAESAKLSVVDRIFTRVGASDDLAGGQSTFMVEMAEVSNILRHATSASLLILDEIGRGTSTYDGLSIAWAVVEYISDKKTIGAKTLFATHYHELTELEGQLDGVHNYCVAIKESGDDIVFLRKIQRGCGDRSYGIEVAKLAGLPHWVVHRAQEILKDLLENNTNPGSGTAIKARSEVVDSGFQMSLFAADDPKQEELIDKLKSLKVLEMTPMQALQTLYDLSNQAKEIR